MRNPTKGPSHGQLVDGVAELRHSRGRQAIGAIEPGVLEGQTAAGIPAGVGERVGGHLAQALDRQVQRIVADQHGLAGGGLAQNRFEPARVVDRLLDHSVGRGGFAVNIAIGPRRVKVAVGCPRGIPRVGEPVVTMHAEKLDAGQFARLLERTAGRRFRLPDERRKRALRFPGLLPRSGRDVESRENQSRQARLQGRNESYHDLVLLDGRLEQIRARRRSAREIQVSRTRAGSINSGAGGFNGLGTARLPCFSVCVTAGIP